MAEEEQGTTDEASGEQPLGPEGEKALQAFKERARVAEKEAKRVKVLEGELEKLREQAMSEQEKAIAQARKEAAEEVRGEMMREIVRAKLSAAATGRLADPDDAVAFIDITDLQDEPEAISGALDALLERKPHLAASATRSSGFDAGARGSGDPSDMNALIRRQARR